MCQQDRGIEIRKRLTKAFIVFRRIGLIARQNFMCCQGCACSQLWVKVSNTPKAVGVVHYSKQDGEQLSTRGSVMLSFSHKSEKEEDTRLIGKVIVETLRLFGLIVSWNGSIDERIEVIGIAKT